MQDEALNLKLTESLIKASQNLQTSVDRYSATLDKVVGKFEDIDTYQGEINVKLEKGTKQLREKFLGGLKDIGRELKDHILKPFTLIFSAGFIIDAAKAALEHTRRIRDLSYRMGDAGKSAKALSGAMFDVSAKLGISTDHALELVEGLRKMRVSNKDIDQMAVATGRFARVTGVSNDEAIALTGNLMRMGGLGTKATTSILTTMAQTQREVGLTEAEMGQLVESSTQYTRQLANMGKSSGQIESFNKGVVRLAGSFAKVGLNVEDATQLLDKLMDPGQIEDNALLFAKMGMSIQDAVQGNIDPEQMQKGLKQMGEQIKQMGGPAGAAMAKQMGMTWKQALAYSQLDLTKGTKQGAKGLGDMYNDQRSLQEKVQAVWYSIGRFVEKIITPFIPKLEKAFSWLSDPAHLKTIGILLAVVLIGALILFRKRFLAVATDFGHTVGTATTEALVMAQQKASTIAANRPKSRGASSGLMARAEASPGMSAAKEEQNIFNALAQSNVFPKIAKMAEDTARWYHYVGLGSKPLSTLGILTEERNKKLKDQIGFLSQETTIMTEAYSQQYRTLDVQKQVYETRVNELKSMKSLNMEQTYELKRLTTLTDKILPKQRNIMEDMARMSDLEEKRSQRRINKMNPAFLAQMDKELRDRKQILEAENISLKTHTEDLYNQQAMVKLERESLAAKQKQLYLAKDTSGEYQKIVKRLQEIEGEDKIISSTISEENAKREHQLKEITSIEKQMAQVAATGKAGGGVPVVSSTIHRLNEFIKSAFNSAGNTITGIFERAGNSLKTVGKVLGERLNPVNVIKGIVGKNREEGKSGLGAIGKLAGIVMKIVVALGLMEPVQKLIGMLLHAFKPVIDSLVAILFPALVKILKGVMPLIQVLIAYLLPPLLKVLGLLLIIIGYLIKAIQAVIGIFGKGDLYKAFGTMADGMISAGKDIMNSNDKLNTTLGDTNSALTEGGSNTAGVVSSPNGHLRINSKPGMGATEQASTQSLSNMENSQEKVAANTEAHLTEAQKTNQKLDTLIAIMSGRSGGVPGGTAIQKQTDQTNRAAQQARSG